MGLAFDINAANWVSHLIQPNADIPALSGPGAEKELFLNFLRELPGHFLSSSRGREKFKRIISKAVEKLASDWDVRIKNQELADLREYLSNRPWTALIIPSLEKEDRNLDSYLCSKDFLQELVNVRPNDPGLILQLQLPQEKQRVFSLTDVFPAFRVALCQVVRWPGILLWTDQDSVFLPFNTRERKKIVAVAKWILGKLANASNIDLCDLKKQYGKEYLQGQETIINIIQLSDLHLGSTEARRRLPRVQQLVRNLIAELRGTFEDLGGKTKIIPIVSGDIIQSPDEDDNIDSVRLFMDFLSNLNIESPIIVLGNHDVKKDGWLHPDLSAVLQLPGAGYRVLWFDDVRVGIVCFNSVIENRRAARGYIGERQIQDIRNELDRVYPRKDSKANRKNYDLIAVLHHHPLPVPPPDWYKMPFYEKVGRWFRTEELEDSRDLVNFLEARRFVCALHGHKHIPNINETPKMKIPVFACGSTVGKVETNDRGIYMSMNVVTLDPAHKKLSGRLLAQRVLGGELREEDHHEMIFKAQM